MKSYLLGIGDELLIGQVVDTNTVWMAQQLQTIGVRVVGKSVVSDDGPQIRSAVVRALQEADLVLVTGGLGATKDDITKRELAQLFDSELVWHAPTYDHIVEIFAKMKREMNEAHNIVAYQPAMAKVLQNSQGLCPGMWFQRPDGKVVVSMPGVPFEMQAIMRDHVLPMLPHVFSLSPVLHHTILTAGIGETQIAEQIEAIETRLPKHIKLAYLPSLGTVRLRLSALGQNELELRKEMEHIAAEIVATLGSVVAAQTDISLQVVVSQLLKENNKTLALAESCTGGYLSQLLVVESGASDVFRGGIIAYHNQIKMDLLGVSSAILNTQGAVSEACATAMAVGVRQLLGADYGMGISGIAGPLGGTPDKPVGTVCIAVAGPNGIKSITVRFARDRKRNIEASSFAALNLLRLQLLGEKTTHQPLVE